jgi:hypothetical protein
MDDKMEDRRDACPPRIQWYKGGIMSPSEMEEKAAALFDRLVH